MQFETDRDQFLPIPALVGSYDNYIWYRANRHGEALLVDPGEAEPVIERFEQQGLRPTVILITHHHFDHVDGVEPLLKRYPGVQVYGPELTPLASITHRLRHGDRLKLSAFDLQCDIIATPGHTLDHICYYSAQQAWLLCGDTLFSAGCGRMFEGTPKQFTTSLQLLADLPDKTAVYCAHEYTIANLNFARKVEPENTELARYQTYIEQLRADGEPSLPGRMDIERAVNPFLRSGHRNVNAAAAQQAGRELNSNAAVFAVVRDWKDNA